MEKLILFDLDGTLWDTCQCTYEFIKDYLEKKNLPYEVSKETVINNMGNDLSGCAEGYFPQLEKETREKLLLKIFEYENECLDEYQSQDILYKGVDKVLQELSKKYKIGIVSNCSDYGYIENFIRISKTKNYISDYIPASKFHISKSEAIKKIMEKEKITDAIYVGDTKKDQESAKEAKIPFIYAKYGFGKNIESQYEIAHIKDLPKIIELVIK